MRLVGMHAMKGTHSNTEHSSPDCGRDWVIVTVFGSLTSVLWNELLDIAGNVLIEL